LQFSIGELLCINDYIIMHEKENFLHFYPEKQKGNYAAPPTLPHYFLVSYIGTNWIFMQI